MANAKASAVEVIPDPEQERVWDRVAAIDVAKDSGMVCVRVPDEDHPGRRASRVWSVPARMGQVIELADHLAGERVEQVTLEATSDYWRMFFYLFEAAGLNVVLVNAREVKNVPGRAKTDKKDAVWLAKLTERGMLRASFVPPARVRELRDYTRMRVDLTRDRTRCWQRLEKLLEDALIKISSVASKLTTRSTREMIRALVRGERDPRRLADLARGPMRAKIPQLVEALTGTFDDHHGELAAIWLDQIDYLDEQIEGLTGRIETLIGALPDAWGIDADGTTGPEAGHGAGAVAAPVLDRLAAIPGLSRDTAATIIAETGLDMSRFPTAGHLVSWARLCPRTVQSGARSRSRRGGKGNPYLKGALGQAAAAAARTDTFLGHRFRRLVKRMGKPKAYVAIARSILVVIWHLLNDPTASFYDLGPDYYAARQKTAAAVRNHVRHLRALGFEVSITPAA